MNSEAEPVRSNTSRPVTFLQAGSTSTLSPGSKTPLPSDEGPASGSTRSDHGATLIGVRVGVGGGPEAVGVSVGVGVEVALGVGVRVGVRVNVGVGVGPPPVTSTHAENSEVR